MYVIEQPGQPHSTARPSPFQGLADYLRKQADNQDVTASSHRLEVSLDTLRGWAEVVDAAIDPASRIGPLHRGMKVDYTGMLNEAVRALRSGSNRALAFMLDELRKHLGEMGKCFYAGELQEVDQFLQLYCVARDKRPAQNTGGHPAATDFAKLLHYPECWDTAAYPTLQSAIWEALSAARCTNTDCPHPAVAAASQQL